jgi:hypothetical protein
MSLFSDKPIMLRLSLAKALHYLAWYQRHCCICILERSKRNALVLILYSERYLECLFSKLLANKPELSIIAPTDTATVVRYAL